MQKFLLRLQINISMGVGIGLAGPGSCQTNILPKKVGLRFKQKWLELAIALVHSVADIMSASTGFHLQGAGVSFPPNNQASIPKKSTITLHHRQNHYLTETLLLKNNSVELQICTVH